MGTDQNAVMASFLCLALRPRSLAVRFIDDLDTSLCAFPANSRVEASSGLGQAMVGMWRM